MLKLSKNKSWSYSYGMLIIWIKSSIPENVIKYSVNLLYSYDLLKVDISCFLVFRAQIYMDKYDLGEISEILDKSIFILKVTLA